MVDIAFKAYFEILGGTDFMYGIMGLAISFFIVISVIDIIID